MADENYKDVIKQYIDTVKEIVGDSKTFEQMFESVVKIQEKVMTASAQSNENGALTEGESKVKRIGANSDSVAHTQINEVLEELKMLRKRVARLERHVLKSNKNDS
ncbi:hypothetical protein EDL79_03520 [Ehrlichia ruminantium]|uniref:Uncharacterized protein n=1 Tax=Ehrlichia ruminantium TaxID=779 RepID=A0AAE6UIN2_EHRRU|nr:hypothetical protein [Ehrlichia ruminantium]QGR02691.1 hypothetical protein EDL81_03505 [Ehrlichia ruminantium]QGR03612.1 hypothetical protein EDL80_03510 [Ehrlichia ruminantium]QGR04539.1 hypothetical protein EDL79_03520 [Ehrlichia ruminantium]